VIPEPSRTIDASPYKKVAPPDLSLSKLLKIEEG
jgi:hypothetical protein